MCWKTSIFMLFVISSSISSLVIPNVIQKLNNGDERIPEPAVKPGGVRGVCVNGLCETGYVCGIGSYCYPILSPCIMNMCPVGETCGYGNSCYQGPSGSCVGGMCPSGSTCLNGLCFSN